MTAPPLAQSAAAVTIQRKGKAAKRLPRATKPAAPAGPVRVMAQVPLQHLPLPTEPEPELAPRKRKGKANSRYAN